MKTFIQTVTLPIRSVEDMLDAAQKMSKAQDELEDYLFMSNPKIVSQLRKSHREALAGKGSLKDWDSLRKKYGL